MDTFRQKNCTVTAHFFDYLIKWVVYTFIIRVMDIGYTIGNYQQVASFVNPSFTLKKKIVDSFCETQNFLYDSHNITINLIP